MNDDDDETRRPKLALEWSVIKPDRERSVAEPGTRQRGRRGQFSGDKREIERRGGTAKMNGNDNVGLRKI